MALTVFETTEQLQPCHGAVEQGGGDKVASAAPAAEKAAVMLKETDHGGDGDRPERDAVWNMIQAQQKPPARAKAAPYVHPLVRRSSSLLTQKSLEICTESLGSETGSDGFSDADGATDRSDDDDEEGGGARVASDAARAPAAAPPPPRAFPPPLPSLARRTVGGAVQMRRHRSDGRLVVQAVPVPSPTLFRAQRKGGRLLLSFADTAAPPPVADDKSRGHQVEEPELENDDEEEEEEEEEVEVVDRGTVVEVKVSTQPQARGGGTRVHRSALVINKFVGAEPGAAAATSCEAISDAAPKPPPVRRCAGSTTTAIAALAAASALSAAAAPQPGNGEEEEEDVVPGATIGEHKLLMTAKRRRSKEELMKHMRRCGQLSGKLFFWEPRIATSS